MIDWSRGYECQWRFSEVDVTTWASKRALVNATAATYSADTGTDGVETGTLSCVNPYTAPRQSGWFRIEGLITQGTELQMVEVGTMYFEPESSQWYGGMRTDSLRGTSTIFPASEADPLPDGAWAAKGSDGAARAASLIGFCTPAPVIVEGSFQVPETVVFDLDSTPLKAAKAILDSGGWVARPDGQGRIHIMAAPTEPVAGYGASHRPMFFSKASSDNEGRITYTRAWGSGLRVWDMFRANLPEIGLQGDYRIVSQRVTCGNKITVEETVEEVQ